MLLSLGTKSQPMGDYMKKEDNMFEKTSSGLPLLVGLVLFTLSSTPAQAGLTITSPTQGSLVQAGQPITVTWTGGDPSGNVALILIDVEAGAFAQGYGVTPNTGSQTVTIAGNGGCGRKFQFYLEDSPLTTWTYGPQFTIVCDSVGPVATAVALTPNPAAVNQPVVLAANIDDTDTGLSNIHSAEYSVDGGPFTAMSGTFDTSPTTAAAAVIPAFSTPGVYSVCVRGTDAAGNVGAENCVLLAVYDPDGGFVTGGGWIMSPEGAYTPEPALGGKATFGFVSRYLHGANVPTGSTQFVFHAGGFKFQSTSYDWLVVAGARAKYKGTGSINGQAGFRFMLSAIDGNLLGGGSHSDTFRLKVEDQDGNVIYDNQPGAADGDDPVTELGGGSVVIHKP